MLILQSVQQTAIMSQELTNLSLESVVSHSNGSCCWSHLPV